MLDVLGKIDQHIYDAKSGTPSYKSTPVLLHASPSHEVLRRLLETASK